ncbi:PREDICTED: protein slender lobes [Eufriesea mexicana]|uniref:protein slender lobes n=1 Tax=Eufriesea mexicana TaxID=516756 RepID=UPI00083BBA5D|nr:PREDICTED: protein slender lobes [Eufriesea mexicana]
MKAVWCLLVVLLSRQAICGIIRNPPAFSKPVYLDSYLPAAMQVIFHAVEQLKLLQSEESTSSSTTIANAPTSPITPQNQQPTTPGSSTVVILSEESTVKEETSTPGNLSTQTEVPAPSETSNNKTEESEESRVEVTSQSDETTLPSTPVDKTEESKLQTTPSNQADQSKLDEEPVNKVDQSNSQESSENKGEDWKFEEPSNLDTTPSNQPDQTYTDVSSISNLDESKPQEPIQQQEEEFELEESSLDNAQVTLADAQVPGIDQGSIQHVSMQQESPEVNEEMPETNYATPETNYEEPEAVHAVQETNEEVPEENHEWVFSTLTETTASDNPLHPSTSHGSIVDYPDRRKEPTVDSVVQGVYQILKPTPSKFVDEGAEILEEMKSVMGDSAEKTESVEEEQDETRFTRLGERVTQVPRPSLTSYLRRSKVPPNATLQQLANLYDSLSKDARKQGFGKYTGYSNEVLDTLESSAEGGIGPQLKKILSKVLERNELTRDDARTRTSQTVRDLDNPSSILSKELRPLLPLRYSP